MPLRVIAIAGLCCLRFCVAEHLPIRTYTTADGLPADQVQRISIDSRGFVWFSTPEGLSRFDGYRFVNFGVEEGLAHRDAQAFLETRSGGTFIGTPRGLCEFHNSGERSRFITHLPNVNEATSAENDVTALLESSSGGIWCGTPRGLFEFSKGKFRRQALPDPPAGWKGIEINDLAEDPCGKLWLGTTSGIYVLTKDGSAQRITPRGSFPGDYANVLLPAGGKMWAGTRGGLVRLRDGCSGGPAGVERIYPAEVALNAIALAKGSDGALWVGTGTGLVRLRARSGSENESIEKWTRAQGLADRSIFALASGKSGNVWAGTEGGGVMNIQPGGFTTFNEQDGLRSDRVWSVFEDRAGRLVAVTAAEDQSKWRLNIFDGEKFRSQPAPKVFAEHSTWGSDRILLQSRSGEWWAASSRGLCRYAAGTTESLAGRAPEQCFLSSETVFQVFEDSKGRIWASSQARPGLPTWDRLMRWDPATREFAAFDDFPHEASLIRAFAEDRAGNIWMGEWGGGLFRYDGHHFSHFDSKDGVPRGTVFSLLTDSRGGLWIAGMGGLAWIEDPAAARLQVRTFLRADGLSSNTVRAVVEDNAGYIYAATGTGVDRLNPHTGRFKHFSAADGLQRGETESAIRDRAGQIWFATTLGLSRLAPVDARTSAAPSVLITSLQTGGVAFPISQRGEISISRIELEPSRNQLQVEFAGFSNEPEPNLRYSYRLEDSDAQWSTPRAQPLVNYAALAAGKYRFLVKAVDSDGQESDAPAEVDFVVLPPFWRRAWFEALALLAIASMVYFLHRYRVAQMVSLERMRTSIATDLHDDIGASLSQIAILSEVARAGVSQENRLPQESLQKVSRLARELVDSMSDIVWSIRADPDEWESLVRRMREFALDVLVSQGIDFELDAPPHRDQVHISLQARRQVFLIFKECIHNASRHSGCSAVHAELRVLDGEIALIVADNGRGMEAVDPPAVNGSAGGTGLPGMRRRAAALGGSIQFVSKPGEGCRISIRFPLRRGAFRFGRP